MIDVVLAGAVIVKVQSVVDHVTVVLDAPAAWTVVSRSAATMVPVVLSRAVPVSAISVAASASSPPVMVSRIAKFVTVSFEIGLSTDAADGISARAFLDDLLSSSAE